MLFVGISQICLSETASHVCVGVTRAPRHSWSQVNGDIVLRDETWIQVAWGTWGRDTAITAGGRLRTSSANMKIKKLYRTGALLN